MGVVASVIAMMLCGIVHAVAQHTALLDAFTHDAEVSPMWDAVERFREAPVCLRAADKEDLMVIPGVSARTAARIVAIASARPTWSVGEISDSLCLGIAQRLMLMLCTTRRCDTTTWQARVAVRTTSRLDVVQRISARSGAWRIDAQAARAHDERGDVGHVGGALGGTLANTQILLGDVGIRCGTGLVMGALSPSRGVLGAMTFATDPLRLRAWTSTVRTGFIRGLAMRRTDTIEGSTLHTAVVLGHRPLAATIDTSGVVTSIRDDAVLRTAQDLMQREALHESVIGGAASLVWPAWSIGIGAWSVTFDRDVHTKAASDPQGRGGIASTLFGSATGIDAEAAWEVAVDPGGHIALVGRSRVRLDNANVGCSIRWIGPSYRARYGDAPTDASAASNEAGITLAASIVARPHTRLEALADLRTSLTRTYTVPRTVRGLTLDAALTMRWTSAATLMWRIRYDDEDDAVRVDGIAHALVARRTRMRMRGELGLRLTPPLSLTVRADASGAWWSAHRASMMGSALMVRLRGHVLPWCDAAIHVVVHDTPAIDAAVYHAEATMPDVLRSVPLVGSGTRFTATARIRIASWWDTWAAVTSGPTDQRIELMMRWRVGGVSIDRDLETTDPSM